MRTVSWQALARFDYGGNTGALLVVYAVEGFLRRLAASEDATRMTLKDGVLMAATAARRMTKDADLSTTGLANDEARIAEVVGRIATIVLDGGDGLIFDATTIRTEVLREDAEHHGIRAKLESRLATARIPTTIDFSFGDPHRWVIIDLPELLGTGTIRLASFPPEMTLAERIVAMMTRRELNARDRDFADIWVISQTRTLVANDLRSAITEVADHRRQSVLSLADALTEMPDRQTAYVSMLERMGYQWLPPQQWRDLLRDIVEFVDRLVADIEGRLDFWDPQAARWHPLPR